MTGWKKGRIGSSFDDFEGRGFLQSSRNGRSETGHSLATRRVDESPTHEQITNGAADENKPEPAGPAAGSSHSGVTLETLARAAQVLGRQIRVELV